MTYEEQTKRIKAEGFKIYAQAKMIKESNPFINFKNAARGFKESAEALTMICALAVAAVAVIGVATGQIKN